MCLRVIKKKAPTSNKVVYKLVRVSPSGVTTPYRHACVKPGALKAKGIRPSKTTAVVSGGAIHAYVSLKAAQREQRSEDVILRCVAKPEHFVAYGRHGDVCYTQIEVPQKEFATRVEKAQQQLVLDAVSDNLKHLAFQMGRLQTQIEDALNFVAGRKVSKKLTLTPPQTT
jgi:hypothetical protein